MKKISIVVLALVLCLSLIGCQKKEETKQVQTSGGEMKVLSESEFYSTISGSSKNESADLVFATLKKAKEDNGIADEQVEYAVLSSTDSIIKDKIEIKSNLPVAYAKRDGKIKILAVGVANLTCESLKGNEMVRVYNTKGYAVVSNENELYTGYTAQIFVYGSSYLTQEEYDAWQVPLSEEKTPYGKLQQETGKESFKMQFYGSSTHILEEK